MSPLTSDQATVVDTIAALGEANNKAKQRQRGRPAAELETQLSYVVE